MLSCCNSVENFLNFNSFSASLTILNVPIKKYFSPFPHIKWSPLLEIVLAVLFQVTRLKPSDRPANKLILGHKFMAPIQSFAASLFSLGHKAIKNKTGREYGTSNDEKHHDPKHLVLGRLSLRTSQHFEHSVTWFYPCSLRQAHRKHIHFFNFALN